MTAFRDLGPIEKIPTGIEGLDHITMGGLPSERLTLIVGSSGSGKTVLGLELAHQGIKHFDRPAVYFTFEEPPRDLVRDVHRFGWDILSTIESGKLHLVDTTRDPSVIAEVGEFDLSGLILQVRHLVQKSSSEIVIFDSIGALFQRFQDTSIIRREIFRLAQELKELGVTGILTAERLEEYGPISRYGVEEYASDNVVILRNVLDDERCRRTIQILKMRGDTHYKGEFPFTISEKGISVIPLSAVELKQASGLSRIRSGNEELDKMTTGGFFQDSIILVSGPTGGGKTLMATTFAAEGCRNGDRVLFLGYEESHQQLVRNAGSWGIDFARWELEEKLRISCQYPEAMGIEDHLLHIRHLIEEFKPSRLVVDSVSAMERVASLRTFREFIIGLTSFAKQEEICGLFTSTTPKLSGSDSITEAHISTITDAIILLRYVEINGVMRRAMSVIKMRGTQHDKRIREFSIDSNGITLGNPFKNVHNIILGVPYSEDAPEVDNIGEMFEK